MDTQTLLKARGTLKLVQIDHMDGARVSATAFIVVSQKPEEHKDFTQVAAAETYFRQLEKDYFQ